MQHSNAPKRPYADMTTSLIKLTLMMGAWGKSYGNRKLTEDERAALAAELAYRRPAPGA